MSWFDNDPSKPKFKLKLIGPTLSIIGLERSSQNILNLKKKKHIH